MLRSIGKGGDMGWFKLAADKDSSWCWQQVLAEAVARLKEPVESQVTRVDDLALRRCGEQIKYYSDESAKYRRWHNLYFLVTVSFSGILPFLVWWQSKLGEAFLKTFFGSWHDGVLLLVEVLIPLLPAIVAISASMESKYRWRDHHARYAYTCEQLKAEMFKFLVGAQAYAEKTKAAANLICTTEKLALNEAKEWQETLNKNERNLDPFALLAETREKLSAQILQDMDPQKRLEGLSDEEIQQLLTQRAQEKD